MADCRGRDSCFRASSGQRRLIFQYRIIGKRMENGSTASGVKLEPRCYNFLTSNVAWQQPTDASIA